MAGRSRLRAVLFSLASVAGCDFGLNFDFTPSDPCYELECGWVVEQGRTELTRTWHDDDVGTALVDVPTRVSLSIVTTNQPDCLRVSFVGRVDTSAVVTLQLDFNDDGANEHSISVGRADWTYQSFLMRAPTEYTKLKVSLQKAGAGEARFTRVKISDAAGRCADMPSVTMPNGAACSTDTTCTSNSCLFGKCTACASGGCSEGESCKLDGDCAEGACAAGVCRACAKRGDCASGERCSVAGQCASRSCMPGATPSMTSFPLLDGTCGECDQPSDCATGQCVLGRCAECTIDADCTNGRVCRYFDSFDAVSRACVPKPSSPFARGVLCEADTDCADGLRCGAGAERAKRCGVACGSDQECAAGETCFAPGALVTQLSSRWVSTLPDWRQTAGRIATCHPVAVDDRCEYTQQCPVADHDTRPGACCFGSCRLPGAFVAGNGSCNLMLSFWPY